ncbi:bifunctional nuclease family protein [Halobellus captivus]|uniref:bifunctional nuclease family protein n=1 Tax=Halobellus captivus TaxID=2592614 RepID=UPI00119F30BA|nr:bifunctional nuclease family protein [Halobellus captivus]
MNHPGEVEGIAVGVDADGENIPAVVIAARSELLPIVVTADQARAIQLATTGDAFERPLTHDLLVEMVTEFGGAIDRVRIDDIADGTFYAKIDAERYEDGEPQRFVFDARPSDAVALAVRVDCPIEISDIVLDRAGQPPERFDLGGGDGPDGIDDDPGDLDTVDDVDDFSEFGDER